MTSHPHAFNTKALRKTVLDMAYAGSTVHIGCAFSIIELLAVLYRNHLRYPYNDPLATERDYFVLSKGYGIMAQYACLRELGWLKNEAFSNYFADGSDLKGLSDSRVSGLEVTSGSLGHGFSVDVGMAIEAKLRGTGQKTYALVGDGEINEGPICEGALFAAHHNLKNFIVIVDENGFQASSFDVELDDGTVKKTFSLNRPHYALQIVPGIWRELNNFSSGAICLVLASELYQAADYIPIAFQDTVSICY
ncbi:MAG: WxcM-like domain-containing protein [Methylovulum sp.]|nr:WxcM-like domain-containing protein [Methylovulum sp.]